MTTLQRSRDPAITRLAIRLALAGALLQVTASTGKGSESAPGFGSSFVQFNVFGSYPSCSRVELVSTPRWRLVSFDRLSVRLPDRVKVPSELVAFHHGGRLWKGDKIEVTIQKFIGMSVEPYQPSADLAYRQCTTHLNGAFALIRESASQSRYSVSALFPELGLGLDASSARLRDLALLRTVVAGARPTTKALR
jgi:hypothetical protein